MPDIVGRISDRVIELLGIPVPDDRNIYLGYSNINHMMESHQYDYEQYGDKIEDIIENPDYIGLHKNDGSIEYYKEFLVDSEIVKLAVRISGSGMFFARTLYTVDNDSVTRYVAKGTLLKY